MKSPLCYLFAKWYKANCATVLKCIKREVINVTREKKSLNRCLSMISDVISLSSYKQTYKHTRTNACISKRKRKRNYKYKLQTYDNVYSQNNWINYNENNSTVNRGLY